jgi:hypothetical protein
LCVLVQPRAARNQSRFDNHQPGSGVMFSI